MGFVSDIANNVAGIAGTPQVQTAPKQTPPMQTPPGQVVPGQVNAQHIANAVGGKGGMAMPPPSPTNAAPMQPLPMHVGSPMQGKGGMPMPTGNFQPTGRLPLASQTSQAPNAGFLKR